MSESLKSQRVPLLMSEAELKALDDWRRTQDDLPSRGEAIRRLLNMGLEAAKKAALS